MEKKLKRNFAAYDDLEIFIEYRKSRDDENYDPEDKKLLKAEFEKRSKAAREFVVNEMRKKDLLLPENRA